MKSWIMSLACVALFAVACPQQDVRAEGIFSDGGPDAGTPEYYQYHANSPVGSRQFCKKGKVWPPYPRPTGPHQPCAHKYHAATYWPWPYVCQDRAVVESTTYTQIENGWITATTLYDFHFDAETGELNTSGRRQLHWILTHVPQNYQRLYVSSTFDQQTTQARTQSVEMAFTSLNMNPLPMQTRMTAPLTRAATVVETIDRAAVENLPIPAITYTGISGGGGGGGGGGN